LEVLVDPVALVDPVEPVVLLVLVVQEELEELELLEVLVALGDQAAVAAQAGAAAEEVVIGIMAKAHIVPDIITFQEIQAQVVAVVAEARVLQAVTVALVVLELHMEAGQVQQMAVVAAVRLYMVKVPPAEVVEI
jgi:hypothetical protein